LQHREDDLKDIYIIIAKNIKKYREKSNLTQKELALKSGYSYAYIRRVEAPKCNKNFSIQTVYNLSKALEIEIEYLFIDDDI